MDLEALQRAFQDPGCCHRSGIATCGQPDIVLAKAAGTQVYLAASSDLIAIAIPDHTIIRQVPPCAID
jgi:hypothetical protein